MCSVIRISDDLYKRLEGLAKGFDTPSSVIEKLVNQTEGSPMKEKIISKATNNITKEVISKAYIYATGVYEQKTSISEAQSKLVKEFSMDSGSARVYISNFQKMMSGDVYQMTMNGMATDYYLGKIYDNYGRESLEKALSSVDQHIEYYETFSNGRLQNIRKIYNKFSKLI